MKSPISCLGLVAYALTAPAFAGTDREAVLDGSPAPLHGSLSMPEGTNTVPAVLMLAGSGPTDRDGNSTLPGMKPATLLLLAQALAADGIASLRTDKRGIGASAQATTSEHDLRFSTYVDDAVRWAMFLKTQPRVKCVVILGHSEGALIGALAADRTAPCGFISIAGAGRTAPDILAEQLNAQATAGALPKALLAQALDAIATLKKGQLVADPPAQLAALFRPSVQPYLISWFPQDPVAAIAAVKGPVLVLQGENDLQISVDDAQRLAAARPGIELVALPGVNHALKTAPSDRAANMATYADPSLPLAPGVVSAIVAFIRKNADQ